MRASLGELGTVITGNTPSKQELKYWASSDIPFIKPDVMNQDGITELQTANEYVSEIARSKARIVGKSVVLVTCIGTIGKVCLTGRECAFNQQINAIIPNGRVLPEYLAYCIYYNRPKLTELANAPVVPIINKRQFEDFSVNIEENVERQGSIVTILKEVDRLICYRRQQLQKLDELVKARFVEMFGELDKNPYGWKLSSLGALIASCEAGWSGTGTQRKKRDGEVAVLKVSAVTKGYFIPSECKVLDNQSNIKKYIYPQTGDLLFSRANTREMVGATVVITEDFPEHILPDKLWKIRFVEAANVWYMKYALSSKQIRSIFSSISTGTSGSMYNVSMEKFKSIEIPLPPLNLQNQFAAFVTQTDKSKAVIQKALDEAQLLFDSLMQQYFG